MLQYLMDENVNPLYSKELRRLAPDLVVWAVGEPDAPPRSTLDPEILIWCEVNNSVLVTNNRASMPVHLADHLAQGRHIPGIFILKPTMSIGETLDELILVAGGSFEAEYRDQIVHLPIPRIS